MLEACQELREDGLDGLDGLESLIASVAWLISWDSDGIPMGFLNMKHYYHLVI